VAVEHRAIVNTILWRNRYYGIDSRDRNLQLPAFSFDSSVLDIFCFLAAGGSLVIPDEDLRFDPRYLRDLIQNHGVSRFIITSSYYKVLVRELKGLTSLRSITVAGESTTPELVSGHYSNLPGVQLINEYGPTENAVCSTACVLRDGEPSVPIGVPVANVKVFILDENMRLVPVGVPGEIFLGGCGLARGYLNQPELTAERFIQSPLTDYYEGRLYRTGDWGCWRSDGMLEFQGRVDRQVKVRGFRIELGEIEKVLLQHPRCDDVLVLCKERPSGDKYLAAYAASGSGVDARELSAYAGRFLPYYMAPDAITVMPALPINLNGKVDLEYLRGLDDFQSRAGAASEPQTAEETALLELCRTVFKQPRLGAEDNFFAMGANSLAAMELATAIQGRLGIRIEFPDVYTYPTVRELALRMGTVSPAQLRMAANSAAN
jgi:acyl-coenzyme A synthetase/AMP-(fatty) acid ligase/acyl carrier protein